MCAQVFIFVVRLAAVLTKSQQNQVLSVDLFVNKCAKFFDETNVIQSSPNLVCFYTQFSNAKRVTISYIINNLRSSIVYSDILWFRTRRRCQNSGTSSFLG